MYRFGIMGSDSRMKYLCEALINDGYDAKAADISDIDGYNVIVLPVGEGYDGIIQRCVGKTVLAGFVGKQPQLQGVRILNYAANEYFKTRNAYPTAEGAVKLAADSIDCTLRGSRVLILGYGNIGKCLTGLLCCIGADVTVAARRVSDRALAENAGAAAVGFERLPVENAEIIFNTVPAPVLSRAVLERTAAQALIIDLASRPGGTDFEYAAQRKINTVHALGIPGKYSPRTAGLILKETVLTMLTEV